MLSSKAMICRFHIFILILLFCNPAGDALLANEERSLLTQFANGVQRRNPFVDVEAVPTTKKTKEEKKVVQVQPHEDVDLREKDNEDNTNSSEEGGFNMESHSRSEQTKKNVRIGVDGDTESRVRNSRLKTKTAEEEGGKEVVDSAKSRGKYNEICVKYEQHFSFFCVRDVNDSERHEEILSKFCPMYKKACSTKPITSQQLRPVIRPSATLVVPPPLPPFLTIERKIPEKRDHKSSFDKVRRAPSLSTRRKIYRKLRAINSLTMDPTNIYREPASIVSRFMRDDKSPSHDGRPRAYQVKPFPIIPSDSALGAGDIKKFYGLTDSSGVLHRPQSRSPFTKPGLWEPNPDNPHNRDHANKYYYNPRSVSADWLSGQLAWGAHWAVPAAGVGGTDGFSTVHFPTIGTFLNIPDDYD